MFLTSWPSGVESRKRDVLIGPVTDLGTSVSLLRFSFRVVLTGSSNSLELCMSEELVEKEKTFYESGLDADK